MNIEITNDVKMANAITHRGCFHADEVFATILLILLLKKVVLARISSVDELPRRLPLNPIIYDIGHGVFDHHQPSGNGRRENGIMYSSFGLIWKAYGVRILKEHFNCSDKDVFLLAEMIDKDLVQGIDASDNGQIPSCGLSVHIMGISSMIASFYPSWDKVNPELEDKCFLQALGFANTIFNNVVSRNIAKLRARDIVEKAIEKSYKNILILDQFVPWKDWLLTSEHPKAKQILFVVYPSNRNEGYEVMAVPKRIGSNFFKKTFPLSWAGLTGLDLVKQTNIPFAMFCHSAGFLATAKTFAAAMRMARLAIRCS